MISMYNYITWRSNGKPFCEETLTYFSQLSYNRVDDILKLEQFGYSSRDLVKMYEMSYNGFGYLIDLADKGIKVEVDDIVSLFSMIDIRCESQVYEAISLAGSLNEALNSNGIPNIEELKASIELPKSVDMNWDSIKLYYNYPKLNVMDYLEYKGHLGRYNAINIIKTTIEAFEENDISLSLLEGAPDYQDFVCYNRDTFVEASHTRPAIIEYFQQYSYLNLPSETLKAVLDEMLKAL